MQGQARARRNTVYLTAEDDDGRGWRLGWLRPLPMYGAFHGKVGHLAFDHARVDPGPARREQLAEQFRAGLGVRGGQRLRGENPGGTPWCGAPPGGCG